MSVISVTAEQPYQVFVEAGAANRLADQLGNAARVAVIYTSSVEHVAQLAKQQIRASGARLLELQIPDGEQAKTLLVAQDLWSELAKAGFTRADLIVGIGGGAVTDLAGFIAAAWLRGVDFVTIPTTVLGMVDAAVGGKTGLNLPEGKNLVGAFHEPRAVLVDLNSLSTLPARDISSGLAEVIKAGFVADPRILELISANPNRALQPGDELAQLISWGIEFKARVVSADLKERTSTQGNIGRELLNYGHTLGHAIERHEDFRLRHGEAISIGMVFAAELSRRLAGLSAEVVQVHRELLQALHLPISYRDATFAELAELMSRDKKTRGNMLRFIGLSDLQAPTLIEGPNEADLLASYQAIER